MAQLSAAERPPGALRRALVPLALAQFITGKLPREAPGCCKCAAPVRARRAGSQLQLPAAPGCSAAAAAGGVHLLLEDPGAATVV